MLKILEIVISVFSLVYILDFATSRKLVNRYMMFGIFGRPGSGKSTYLTKMMYKHIKRGGEVYSDDPTVKVEGVQYFNPWKFKSGEWLPDGRKGRMNEDGKVNEENRNIVMFFDEIGSLYNNREFKTNLNQQTLEGWKEHRHRKVKIYYGSQSYKDMDLKIRALTDRLMIVRRAILQNFALIRPILIKIDITNNENSENNAGGQIIDTYKYDLFIFGRILPLQKGIKKFDSYR